MARNQQRLELFIDVFEKEKQRALALPDLTPPELIGAILQEFRELEYLAADPHRYTLVGENGTPADPQQPIGQQFRSSAHLRLVEPAGDPPSGAAPAPHPAYVRDIGSGAVYSLLWLPAIIGRPDPSQGGNELVAVNLESHKTGLRVSRRHAMISAVGEGYAIESLSQNPTRLRHEDGSETVLSSKKAPLRSGDVILLERSGIGLKFIVRSAG